MKIFPCKSCGNSKNKKSNFSLIVEHKKTLYFLLTREYRKQESTDDNAWGIRPWERWSKGYRRLTLPFGRNERRGAKLKCIDISSIVFLRRMTIYNAARIFSKFVQGSISKNFKKNRLAFSILSRFSKSQPHFKTMKKNEFLHSSMLL